MKKLAFLSLFLLFMASATALADGRMTEEQITTSELATFRFLQYIPEDTASALPLIVYFHGGGGKGDDLNKVKSYLFPQQIEAGYYGELEAVVICPQVPTGKDGWSEISDSVFELIDYMCETYNINERKISIIGHSMGGTGAWSIACKQPERFSCIVPMSGSVTNSAANVNKLKNMPIRAFVSTADRVVNAESSINFVNAIKEADNSADCEITVYTTEDHEGVLTTTLTDETLNIVGWVLSNERKNTILGYTGSRINFKIQVPGEYTLIFADFDNGILQSVAMEKREFSYGKSSVQAADTGLYTGDRIFLWDFADGGAVPYSAAYTVRRQAIR